MSTLPEIGKLIREQDNRATDAPLFAVQQRRRIWGMDRQYTGDYKWLDEEGLLVDNAKAAELEKLGSQGELTAPWYKGYYIDIWEFVTGCFTEQGCEDYLRANRHNLTDPRIFAYGSYRNREFRAVRTALEKMSEEEEDNKEQ